MGNVIKAIERINILHLKGTHEREMILDLGKQPLLTVKQLKEQLEIERKPKKYLLHTIKQAKGFKEDQMPELVKQR